VCALAGLNPHQLIMQNASFIGKPRKCRDQINLFTTIVSLLADSQHKKQAMLLMTIP
jgi:hypothetical protein